MQQIIISVADIKEVDNVNEIAKAISSENKAFINPSKLGIKNILPITAKNISVIAIVTPMKINSSFERIFLTP
jgi:hypothetical protein